MARNPIVSIFADESWTSGAPYRLLGGIWIGAESERELRASIAAFRVRHRMTREMKWKKVSAGKLGEYEAFVDLFFAAKAGFHCIVLPCAKLDWRRFHRTEERGFWKFYFLLLSRKLVRGCEHYIRLDQRTGKATGATLSELRLILNNWWRKKHPADPECVRAVEARDSKKDDIVQLADVLLGATAASWNGGVTSRAKLALIEHIKSANHGRGLSRPTSPSEGKFNVWLWRPGNRETPQPL